MTSRTKSIFNLGFTTPNNVPRNFRVLGDDYIVIAARNFLLDI